MDIHFWDTLYLYIIQNDRQYQKDKTRLFKQDTQGSKGNGALREGRGSAAYSLNTGYEHQVLQLIVVEYRYV